MHIYIYIHSGVFHADSITAGWVNIKTSSITWGLLSCSQAAVVVRGKHHEANPIGIVQIWMMGPIGDDIAGTSVEMSV